MAPTGITPDEAPPHASGQALQSRRCCCDGALWSPALLLAQMTAKELKLACAPTTKPASKTCSAIEYATTSVAVFRNNNPGINRHLILTRTGASRRGCGAFRRRLPTNRDGYKRATLDLLFTGDPRNDIASAPHASGYVRFWRTPDIAGQRGGWPRARIPKAMGDTICFPAQRSAPRLQIPNAEAANFRRSHHRP